MDSFPFRLLHVGLTDGIFDENHLVGLDERSHAYDVLSCNSEEVAFAIDESLYYSIVSCHCVRYRGPTHAV